MGRAQLGKRTRKKDGLDVIKAVQRAGGEVTITSKGHLRVVGPKGITIISSDPANNSMRQTVQCIKRHSGLTIEL